MPKPVAIPTRRGVILLYRIGMCQPFACIGSNQSLKVRPPPCTWEAASITSTRQLCGKRVHDGPAVHPGQSTTRNRV
jgi:hypothetical protein